MSHAKPMRWLSVLLFGSLGLAVRLLYIDYDLPRVVWVDSSKFVDQAADMVRSGSYAPQSYQYPGFYTYTLAILYGGLGLRSGYAQHLTANLVSALLSAGVVPATWWMARRVCKSHSAAAAAAALSALSPVLVGYGRIPCTDGIAATFVTLAGAAFLAPRLEWRGVVLGAIATGFAAGAKFTGAYPLLLLCLVSASALQRGELPLRRAAAFVGAGCGLSLVTFLSTTPWFVPRFDQYVERLRFEANVQRFGQIGRIQLGYLDYLWSATPTWESPWLGTSIATSEGLVVLVVGLAACGLAVLGRLGRPALLCALYLMLYFVLMSGPGHLKAIRFLALVLPVLFVLCGSVLETLYTVELRHRTMLVVLSALCLVVLPAGRTLAFLELHRRPSTNMRTRHWVAEHVPRGATIFLAPFFTNDLISGDLRIAYVQNPGARQYRLPADVGHNPERDPLFHPLMVQHAVEGGVELVVTNSFFMDALSPVAENERWFPKSTASYREYMRALEAAADLVFETRGLEAGLLGPDIRVYRLRGPASAAGAKR